MKLDHVAQKRAKGIAETAEVHGTEAPGQITAGADAAREVAVILALAGLLGASWIFILAIAVALIFWKAGRAAWLGWARLERLHRIIEQERWEITHHRQEEREELEVIYAAKGLEGKLLEDVVEVLMADEDRLLRIMVEEELGLGLATYEHPLVQALGASIGAIGAGLLFFAGYLVHPLLGALVTIAISGFISARFSGNRIIPAIIWNLALATLAIGVGYFVGLL